MAFTMSLSGLGDLPSIYNVDMPVGSNMANIKVDVLLVQQLIKMARFTMFSGGLPVGGSDRINVDGIFGPQTKTHIRQFEDDIKRGGMYLVSDGVLERSPADGFTRSGILYKIIYLNRWAKEKDPSGYSWLPFDLKTHPALRQALSRGAVKPVPHDPTRP